MARPPRLEITVGIAVATAVDSIAPRNSPSITPETMRPRRGGGALMHRSLAPRWRTGRTGTRPEARRTGAWTRARPATSHEARFLPGGFRSARPPGPADTPRTGTR